MTELDRLLRHPQIERLARGLRERPATQQEMEEPLRRAAVALILRGGEGGALELLMIKRAAFERDPWSGHVALPGGRQEACDVSLEQTAIRETWEETGIDLARDGCVLGRLDELRPRTLVLPPLVIVPFVAVLGSDVPIVLSPEVAEAFWVPVSALQDPQASREVVLELTGGPRRVRSFQHGSYTIWGLTERILRQFLALLG